MLRWGSHQPSKMVTLRISREAALFLRDQLDMIAEGIADARGVAWDVDTTGDVDAILDILSDYDQSAEYVKEVYKCLTKM